MTIRKKLIKELANEALSFIACTEPWVDVRKIVDACGIKPVPHDPGDEDLSGFLLRNPEDNSVILGVNSTHSKNRQRFTIGHELGHHFLHSNSVHVDGRYQVMNRDAKSKEGNNTQEIEANFFAGELLVPEQMLRADIEKIGQLDVEDEVVVKKLAKRYRVSTQVIARRLFILGY